MASTVSNKPFINVTPLIDVLLVMLIIFMVAAPLRPHRFAAKLPSQPDDSVLPPNINTLVVTIEPDRTLKLNGLSDMGTVDDSAKLSAALVSLFAERKLNRAYRAEMLTRVDIPEEHRLENRFHKSPALDSLWRSRKSDRWVERRGCGTCGTAVG